MFHIGDKLTKENYTDGAIWCKENNATIQKIDSEYVICTVPEQPAPTYEEVKEIRASLYRNEVDPLMAEYTRKKTFNLFEEGEEEALLVEIESKVEEIKNSNPYPEL
jgi:hypothetical protein